MQVPFWLLKLLPMWAYVCPKCEKDVPKNSHECPHCGEKYPMPLRVPPRIWHDRKALEDYVHKHVFPNVSQAHRDYLAQFFTTLFVHGFEGGDFGTDPQTGYAWTGTSGSPEVVSSPTHHGAYALKVNAVSEYVYKSITVSGDVYVRVYYRRPSSSGEHKIVYLMSDATPRFIIDFYLDTTLVVYCGGSWKTEVTIDAVPDNEWICVEGKYGISSGTAELWINGVSVASYSGLSNGAVNTLRVGFGTGSGSDVAYLDCVVVADAYIGPENDATLQTVTDSLSLSDSALRHKALLLISDSAALAEAFSRDKAFTLIDSLNLAEIERVLKELQVHDASSLADAASTVSRILQVSESVSVAEVVQVGVGGVRKTSLFLILGDLALQLT